MDYLGEWHSAAKKVTLGHKLHYNFLSITQTHCILPQPAADLSEAKRK